MTADFAETYHITNWRSLPLSTVSSLAAQLREDSRVMMALSGRRADRKTALLAIIADRLGTLIWHNTKDGRKGRNPPESIYRKIMEPPEEPEHRTFRNGEEFMRMRTKILGQTGEVRQNG